jgi:uncharacterized metal-binding protein
MTSPGIPLVYSCSGCSSAAQLANAVAVGLDRHGAAEMSCIAGVGGDVPSLVRVATSGRPIVAIDGCPLRCAAACLARHDVVADLHVDLSEHGVKRRKHVDHDEDRARELVDELAQRLASTPLRAAPTPPAWPAGETGGARPTSGPFSLSRR